MSSNSDGWLRAILPTDSTIEDVIHTLNDTSLKIVMITDRTNRLIGTISDGDIRRGLLKGLTLGSPVEEVVHLNALVVPPEISREFVLQLMEANNVQQVPVVDEEMRVIGIHVWDEITIQASRQNLMIIMAGGKGTRLHPHTENCPKPLLNIAGKPILEHIIGRAKVQGFSNFIVAIHHLGQMIESHFGDGSRMGVKIDYLREKMPLGTAGSLSLISPTPDLPLVVSNGDVLTDIHYGDILDFHTLQKAKATMAVRVHEWQNPFGVVRTEGFEILEIEEKPVSRSNINAGVYVIEPSALQNLQHMVACDMPQLFARLGMKGDRIVAYPLHERWLDIGRPIDLEAAKFQQSIGSEVNRGNN
jgi:dTDP-glucose pyrophosphorylase